MIIRVLAEMDNVEDSAYCLMLNVSSLLPNYELERVPFPNEAPRFLEEQGCQGASVLVVPVNTIR